MRPASSVHLLLVPGFADWEPAHAVAELRRAGGLPVVTVALDREPVESMGGLRVVPDRAVADVQPEDVSVLILPGGERWEQGRPDPAIVSLLRRLDAAGVPLAAICAATTAIAHAGVLRGRRHTSNGLEYFKALVPDYAEEAHYVDRPVVRDGGLITAGGLAGPEFAAEIMAELGVMTPDDRGTWVAMVRAGRPTSEADGPLRPIVEWIPHIVWTANVDGSTNYLNSRGVAHLRLPPSEIKGWRWLNLLHPDDVERARRGWEEAVRAGSEYRNEYRVRGVDGQYRWYLSQATPVRRDGATIEGWVGTWTDIDDLKRAEERLARDALLLSNVQDAVIVTDPAGVVTYWNDGATRLYGWTADEMLGRPQTERYPEKARADVERVMRETVTGGSFAGEWEDYRKDGSRVSIYARVAALTDASGNPVGVMGISHDISERKRAEAALRLRDRAIQAVSEGIVITDPHSPDNPIIWASPGFERLTGYPNSEVLGRNCRFLQGEDTDEDAVARLRSAVREARPCAETIRNYRKDGTPFWNEVSISPVTDDEGRLVHFVGVQTDVSDRRALEEQYRQAQKMEAIGQLAGGVAHDFNNLVTIVVGYSEMLLDETPLDDASREMLDEIKSAGERSASLARQLLAFSRRQVLAPERLDLSEVVRDTERMLRRLIGEDVELATRLASGPLEVKADRGQLQQVLLNLAVNARDAMPRGGTLTIETSSLEVRPDDPRGRAGWAPGPYVTATVADAGGGMTEEVRRRIFEPFFTTKPAGRGTGLGLSVVDGIIRQSGGHVEVESEVGQGTAIRLLLPQLVDEDSREHEADSAIAGAPRGSETVLLVEDDDAVRGFIRRALGDCGYRVIDARDGSDAERKAIAQEGQIDLLVTDVVMPQMGGRELAERLSALQPGLRVLYVSGYTTDAVVRHGVLHETVAFLQKPFTPLALARKVREVLSS